MAVAFGGHREAPEDRPGKRVFDRFAFGGIAAARPEIEVRLRHQHLRAHTMKADDPAAGFLAAIETDIVRSESGGQAGREQKIGVEARDLEEQASRPLVPVERKEAIELL